MLDPRTPSPRPTAPSPAPDGTSGRRVFSRYSVAVLSSGVALLVRLLGAPYTGPESPFLLFVGAVTISAWYGGLGPGLAATLLSALAADFFFLPPEGQIGPRDLSEGLRLLLFVLEGALVTLLSVALRASRRRSQAAAADVASGKERLWRLLETLGESEARFRTLADTAPVLIWLADPEGLCTFFNKPWLDFTGRTIEQELGNGWLEGVHPEDLEGCLHTYRTHFAARLRFRMELRLRRADGEYRWVLDTGQPRFSPEGEFLGYIGSAIDITERKLGEEERTRLLIGEREARELAEAGQQQLRFLADVIPQIVWTARPDGHLDYYNRRWFEYTGFTEEESLSPEGWKLVLHRDDVDRSMESWYHAVATGDAYEIEYRFRRASDGTYRWHLGRALPLLDRGGRIVKWFGTCTDIDDQKRVDESTRFLAEATAVLASSLEYEGTLAAVARLAVQHVADWFLVHLVEPAGGFRRLAVAHADPEREAVAWELERRWPPRADAPFGPARVLATGRAELAADVTDSILEAVAVDSEHLQVLRGVGFRSYMCVPLVARGQILGALTFVSAESGRRYGPGDLEVANHLARRAALALENARLYREAQEASRVKDEFLATLSHELRTPLNAMLGWAHLLRSGRLDPETSRRAVETIERSTRLQARLIEDLLDVSRIVTGKLRLESAPVDLPAVITAAVEVIRPAADAKSIRIDTDLDPQIGPVVGDAGRLQQVVWNLLSNAVKFTPRGGLVEVILERAGSEADISVRDTGRGIPPEFLPQVFERFRQVDSSTTRAYGGLGLGLAIVRHLVELHGGSVRAQSAGEGQGATFSVRLPLKARAAARSPQPPYADAGPRPAIPSGDGHPLAGVRVLVVDDEADARELLIEVLRRCGAEADAVPSTADALAYLESRPVDVLVSDIGLPFQDGYELIRRVQARQASGGPAPAAVALTAYARDEDRRAALRAGFQRHLAKPVEPDDLCRIVAELATVAARSADGRPAPAG
jgi:PAS domain S-box-containing protein